MTNTLTEEERDRRAAAVRAARGSNELEGYEVPPQFRALDDDFINGKLDIAEYIAAVRAAVLAG